MPPRLRGDPGFSARAFDGLGQLRTDGIGKGDVGHDAISEERVHTVAGAVEKLVGDHKLQGLMLFLQRSHGGNGNDPLHAQLLEAINVGPEIQLGGQNAVSAAVTGQERDFTAFQRAQNVGVRGFAERRLQAYLFDFGEAGHGVQPAAANDSDFCLWQRSPRKDGDYTGRPCGTGSRPGRAVRSTAGNFDHQKGCGLSGRLTGSETRSHTIKSYFATAAIPNISCSSLSVVAWSRLSVTMTVSPCTSMTTGPSSVSQVRLPVKWSKAAVSIAGCSPSSGTSCTCRVSFA